MDVYRKRVLEKLELIYVKYWESTSPISVIKDRERCLSYRDSESLEIVRRLRLFSNTQQPELHMFIVQLQSKLTDVFLDSNASTQRQIIDYFKPVSGVPGRDFGTPNR